MKDKYFPPIFQAKQFHCVHCGVYAAQNWHDVFIQLRAPFRSALSACFCSHCKKWSYWFDQEARMLLPAEAPVEPAHPDLPADCLLEYSEARDVFARSPRAAAALLRLCIQKLMPHLGEKGENINTDIASLVAKGLPVSIQQALDFCRVVGNNAVHPGEIELNDSPEVAQNLFAMINFIVDDRITRPKAVADLYMKLPEKAREAIQKRDNGTA